MKFFLFGKSLIIILKSGRKGKPISQKLVCPKNTACYSTGTTGATKTFVSLSVPL